MGPALPLRIVTPDRRVRPAETLSTRLRLWASKVSWLAPRPSTMTSAVIVNCPDGTGIVPHTAN